MRSKFVILGVIALFIFTGRWIAFFQFDVDEVVAFLAVIGLTFYPSYRWVKEGMKTLPSFELFCLLHFSYYLLPYMEAKPQLMAYDKEIRLQAIWSVVVFLAITTVIYRVLCRKLEAAPVVREGVWDRIVPSLDKSAAFWVLLLLWFLFNLLFSAGLTWVLGDYLNAVRSFSSCAGITAQFYFFLALGQGKLGWIQTLFLFVVVGLAVLVGFTSGFLVSGIITVLVAVIAYGMGSNRIPVITLIVVLAFMNFLQLGKSQMRANFWPEGKAVAGLNVVEVYSFWLEASWNVMFHKEELMLEDEDTSMLKRANLIHMLSMVVAETPQNRPFMMGETYGQIPILFVPRFLWPDKPRGSLPQETMCIYFGIQTKEDTDFTAISFGRIAEAWANFGWFGVALIGGFYGCLLAVPMWFARGRPPNSIGYLIATLFLGYILDIENALGTFLVSLTNTFIGAYVVLYFFSKPRPVPRYSLADAEPGSTAPPPQPSASH